ncbi:response regulator [Hahella sp. SMD15-11]|uniref:Response regulator n=1 Tax=Thermohahella caldifontis TaxID=3142973 RepID=A0AB39UXN5_9GAMM
MPNLDVSILVVDDAKFSSAIIAKRLKNAGYRDVRIANSPLVALKMIEQRPVSILVADWLMPEMDGLALADRVRQLDEATHHFTYVILLTAKESVEALAEAFDRGVDDFIYKSEMSRQLLPRIYAADRIADMHNTLLLANRLLMENNRELEEKNVVDLSTGLGNQLYCRQKLKDSFREIEARGGVTSYALIGIKNWQALKHTHTHAILDELASGIASRLQHLTRPLDIRCRISDNQFVVIYHLKRMDDASLQTYKRLFDGINLKEFKTTAGYISVQAGTGVICIDANEALPEVTHVEKAAGEALKASYETGTVVIRPWHKIAGEILSD